MKPGKTQGAIVGVVSVSSGCLYGCLEGGGKVVMLQVLPLLLL